MWVTPTAVAVGPRALVIVDGSDRAWRALAWAVGYARSRQINALDLVAHPGPWQHVPDAGQVGALMAIECPRVDPEAIRQDIVLTAREMCADNDIAVRLAPGRCNSPGDLIRLARRERPDLVVLGRMGSLPWMGTRRVVSRLLRSGIPVTVVP